MFPAAAAAPFARNAACRGILVLYFSAFKTYYVLLSFLYVVRITISVTSSGSDKPVCHGAAKVRYGCPRSITSISTFCTACYVLMRSVAFDQGVICFFRTVNGSYGQNVDTMQFKAFLYLLYKNKPFEINENNRTPQQPTAELIKKVRGFISSPMA